MRYAIVTFLVMTFSATQAYAADSCESLLCMAGKLQGEEGGEECNDAIAEYFSIVSFRRGKFNPSQTASRRLSFLNSCNAPGVGDWPNRINSVYGSMRSGF